MPGVAETLTLCDVSRKALLSHIFRIPDLDYPPQLLGMFDAEEPKSNEYLGTILRAAAWFICKRSRRLIQKSRDAAALTNIAAKKHP